MKFTLDKQEKFTVFTVLDEKLNSLVAPKLKTELILLNTEGISNVILDLSPVSFVDSSGLSAILVANRLCKQGGGNLLITGVSDNVMRLIKISQLDKVLTILPSIAESRDFVMMHELENELRGEQEEEGGEQGEEEAADDKV